MVHNLGVISQSGHRRRLARLFRLVSPNVRSPASHLLHRPWQADARTSARGRPLGSPGGRRALGRLSTSRRHAGAHRRCLIPHLFPWHPRRNVFSASSGRSRSNPSASGAVRWARASNPDRAARPIITSLLCLLPLMLTGATETFSKAFARPSDAKSGVPRVAAVLTARHQRLDGRTHHTV